MMAMMMMVMLMMVMMVKLTLRQVTTAAWWGSAIPSIMVARATVSSSTSTGDKTGMIFRKLSFCLPIPSEKKKLGLPTQGWGPPLKRRVLEAPGGRTVTARPCALGPDSFDVGCNTSRLLRGY